MAVIEVEGIVLRELPFKENSKILTILTKDYNTISVISKGSRSLKSKLRIVSLKLSYAKFNISYKEKGLSTLINGDIIDPFKNIVLDISRISYVNYILELTDNIIKDMIDTSSIFDIMISGIKKIDEGLDPQIVTNIIEIKYLEYLGILPNFFECVICNNKKDILTISIKDGGYICKNCYNGGKIYNEKIVKLLKMFYLVDLNKLTNINIKDNIKIELDEFIKMYYDEYTGIYLKSKDFIRKLDKVGK